jgi:hypothetical protein
MPIQLIDQQRRLREIGRIRLGEQVPTNNGKTRPKKLTKFRLTSRDQRIIEAVAQAYGGEVKPWTAPDGQQFEVFTDAAEMPVVVPPGEMAFSQWMELWSAGGCQRRCDGVTEVIRDQGCVCDPAARECSTTTRLNVMLPEVPGFGLWRLETHGYYAAVELNGVVELCRQASAAGHLLPARLRLEQRQVKRFKPDGTPQTLKFAVPCLDLDVSVSALGALNAGGQVPFGELAADVPALPAPEGWAPVPVAELPEGPGSSVAEQVAAVADPAPPAPRRNAAAPLPSTGLKPRTAARAAQGATADDEEPAPVAEPSANGNPKGAYFARHDDAARLAGCSAGDLRKRLISILTDGELESASGWAEDDQRWVGLNRLIDRMVERREVPFLKAGGGWELRRVPGGQAEPIEATARESGGDSSEWLDLDGEDWRASVRQAGLKAGDVLRKANEIARQLEVEPPGSVGGIAETDPRLREQLGAWVQGGGR